MERVHAPVLMMPLVQALVVAVFITGVMCEMCERGAVL